MKLAAAALLLTLLAPLPVHAQSADLWSAYSVNQQTGAWGFAMGRSSRNSAYNDSRNGCGRTGCYELMNVYARCIALYAIVNNGRHFFRAGSGNSLDAAQGMAKRAFKSGSPRQVHSLCYP